MLQQATRINTTLVKTYFWLIFAKGSENDKNRTSQGIQVHANFWLLLHIWDYAKNSCSNHVSLQNRTIARFQLTLGTNYDQSTVLQVRCSGILKSKI